MPNLSQLTLESLGIRYLFKPPFHLGRRLRVLGTVLGLDMTNFCSVGVRSWPMAIEQSSAIDVSILPSVSYRKLELAQPLRAMWAYPASNPFSQSQQIDSDSLTIVRSIQRQAVQKVGGLSYPSYVLRSYETPPTSTLSSCDKENINPLSELNMCDAIRHEILHQIKVGTHDAMVSPQLPANRGENCKVGELRRVAADGKSSAQHESLRGVKYVLSHSNVFLIYLNLERLVPKSIFLAFFKVSHLPSYCNSYLL